MSVLLSKLLLVYKNANADTHPRDSVSSMECLPAETEIDFVVNNNANAVLDMIGIMDSPDSVLCRDAMHSIRIIDSHGMNSVLCGDAIHSLRIIDEAKNNVDNIDDHDTNEENKAIEKLICKFASCLVDNVFKQSSCPNSPGTEFLYNESFRLEKGVKFKISMEVHHSVAPINGSYENHESDKLGKESIKLALPPRLRHASYRNPLHLNSDSTTDFTHIRDSCCRPVLCATRLANKIVLKPALYNAMKIQRDFMLKLWASGRDMIRRGKPKLKRPVCLRPLCEGDPDFRRREWLLSAALKFRSKCQKLMCARRSLSSPPT